jgi:nucleoside-diphosphate-sugar epimerase
MAGNNDCIIHEGYADFSSGLYDVVINCIGVGTAKKLKGDYSLYFTVTEEFDNLVINYLLKHPKALYISFSSGAIYGREHSAPVEEDSSNSVAVNHLVPEDYYGIVRLNSEAKHRAFKQLNIVDLRVFSYFSRFIDLSDGYFITEIMDCILNGKVLLTDSRNIVRDYLHPEDLFSMIIKCMEAGRINAAFDVVSARPVEKKEIIDYFASNFSLKYEISDNTINTSATGHKSIYCSANYVAFKFGYLARYTSIDTIINESNYLLNKCYTSIPAGVQTA